MEREGIAKYIAKQNVPFPWQEAIQLIQPGEMAPDFTLESTQGMFTLSSLRGQQSAVLIFYPRDNTPG